MLLAATGTELALNPWAGLVLGLLLVFLNGFFVAAEFALVKVRATQLDPLVARGHRRAKVARLMVRHLDAYLSATQLGITLASLALGWIGKPAFAWVLEGPMRRLGMADDTIQTFSFAWAFATITVLHIILGELAPKSVAIRKGFETSLWVAIPLYFFYKVTYPAIWLLNHAANAVLRLVGIPPVSEHELAHSEEELRLLLSTSSMEHQGALKRELLDNVFELSLRLTRQVMVPRADVVYLSTDRTLEENLKQARQSGHTRFLLCAGDLDKVVGLVHIKDLFRAGPAITDLRPLVREVSYVPETLTLDRLLKKLRSERVHLAAVLDEYGGVSGIVTLENVIEEIVGPIQDEFDTEKPELVERAENVFQVSGQMLVADLEDELEVECSDRDEDTIGGVVLSELGRRARIGDRVQVGPLDLEVLEVERNRIKSLRVRLQRPEPVAAGGAS
jgi:CBS domain containing-hemolysin-like protein